MKPEKLYHGSYNKEMEILKPVLIQSTPDHKHNKPAVFGTERLDIASVFMFPLNPLHSVGFENDIVYICIWGDIDDFVKNDNGGCVYVLPTDSFKKIGKEYEYQSFEPLIPIESMCYNSVIEGMMENGVQVYFINDDSIFDKIVAQKHDRASILKGLISENQKQKINIKNFN